MNEFQQMLYTEMALNNCGMSFGEMIFWLDKFSNSTLPIMEIIIMISEMEEKGNIYSVFNEKGKITEWFIYE